MSDFKLDPEKYPLLELRSRKDKLVAYELAQLLAEVKREARAEAFGEAANSLDKDSAVFAFDYAAELLERAKRVREGNE